MPNPPAMRSCVSFDDFTLQLESGELCKHGLRIQLQEQPLRILRVLLDRAGEVVTRDELRMRIWPGRTFVDFDHGINNAIKRLRSALGDAVERPRYIETLPRKGYRFIGSLLGKRPAYRSLAVLPFANLSADHGQDHFADSLTEALTTLLARSESVRVVSRVTAMLYRDVRKPLSAIAQELGVNVVAAGTVLKSNSRLRVTAQLIGLLEPATETHLWAQCYDRDWVDILCLQSELARTIAHQMHISLAPYALNSDGSEGFS